MNKLVSCLVLAWWFIDIVGGGVFVRGFAVVHGPFETKAKCDDVRNREVMAGGARCFQSDTPPILIPR